MSSAIVYDAAPPAATPLPRPCPVSPPSSSSINAVAHSPVASGSFAFIWIISTCELCLAVVLPAYLCLSSASTTRVDKLLQSLPQLRVLAAAPPPSVYSVGIRSPPLSLFFYFYFYFFSLFFFTLIGVSYGLLLPIHNLMTSAARLTIPLSQRPALGFTDLRQPTCFHLVVPFLPTQRNF